MPLVNKIVRDVNFDDLSTEFELLGNYSLSDGILKLEEPVVSGDPWGDGAVAFSSRFPVIQGTDISSCFVFQSLEHNSLSLLRLDPLVILVIAHSGLIVENVHIFGAVQIP